MDITFPSVGPGSPFRDAPCFGAERRGRQSEAPSSLLKKPPGEGTGPTMHVDFRGKLVGRVPSRGERDVVQQTAKRGATRRSYLFSAVVERANGVRTSVRRKVGKRRNREISKPRSA